MILRIPNTFYLAFKVAEVLAVFWNFSQIKSYKSYLGSMLWVQCYKTFYSSNLPSFLVILSFCVIKTYYFGNYCEMAVNYHGICVTNFIKHNLTKNGSILPHCFKPIIVGFYYCSNLPKYCFITAESGSW